MVIIIKTDIGAITDIMFFNTQLNDIVNIRTIDVGSDLPRLPVTTCSAVMMLNLIIFHGGGDDDLHVCPELSIDYTTIAHDTSNEAYDCLVPCNAHFVFP